MKKQLLLILGCTLLISACGYKGSLILPPKDATPMPITPHQLPLPEQNEYDADEAPIGILPTPTTTENQQ